MKIVYGKNLDRSETERVQQIAYGCDILFDTARLLYYRDIDTVEKAKAFLSPGKNGFNDPYLLSGMKDAVERIKMAKENGESVLVFGDYDADGVCATSVLYYSLKDFGINARYYVPERVDGYGLNVQTIEKLSTDKKVDLLITVDCGISDREKIETLKEKGVDVIVTDHHEPPEDLPNCTAINPKLKNQDYPFDGLCGAGVAYKLGSALIGDKADDYLDLVALATVADSMDLVKENRDIVAEGLKLINGNRSQRLALKYLLGENGKQVTAQTLAYTVAPRVNAGGRMGDAFTALKMFIESDENKVFDLAVKLNEYNVARQARCEEIYREAKAKVTLTKADEREVIMVSDENWQAGFVGIVAAKLVEDYARPVIVFAGQEDYLKGSARSVDGINVFDAIMSAKDLLIAYGGHSQAAGVAVTKDNFSKLYDALDGYLKTLPEKPVMEKTVFAEWDLTKPLSLRFAREIDALEPFGVGNKRPVFTTEVGSVWSVPLKVGSPHYSYKTDVVEILDFNGEKNVFNLSLPIKKKVVFEVNLSSYKSRESLKGYSRAVVPEYDDLSALELYVFRNEIVKLIKDGAPDYRAITADLAKEMIKDGTLFVLSNSENLKRYEWSRDLPISVFESEGKKKSELIISPIKIPDGYDRIVYLDRPIQVENYDGEIYVVTDVSSKLLDKISTDRSVFANYYARLLNLKGKTYCSSVQFVGKNFIEEDMRQAILVLEVFLELGIFKVENGVLTHDEKVKNALTNSKVYSKINVSIG